MFSRGGDRARRSRLLRAGLQGPSRVNVATESRDGMAGSGAFRADGDRVCRFAPRSAVIPAPGSLLGANYDHGDHTVIAGCGVRCFVAAFRRDIPWSGGWRDSGELLRAARPCVRHQPVHSRNASHPDAVRFHGISVRGRCVGDCADGAADGSGVADRASSIHRGIYRNRRSPDLVGAVAGEGGRYRLEISHDHHTERNR